MDKLKVGIVGSGLIADQRHIPSYLRIRKHTVIQAICDKNEDLARELARKYDIPRTYRDISDMLSGENLDIVDICTPPQTHGSLAIEALEHGSHVLLEKPMALKTSDCDLMIEASRTHGRKICVVHNIRFQPPFLEAKKIVAEGAIGEFMGMRILIADHREEMLLKKDHWIHKLPGGLIGETGPHPVYMSLAFIDKINDVDICAKSFLEHSWAPFDEFRLELEGEKAVSSIIISYASNRRNFSIDIFGTEGALNIVFPSMLVLRQGRNESMKPISIAYYQLGIASQIVTGVAMNAFKALTARLRVGHDVVIEKFVNSILNGYPAPVTAEEGRETVRVMEMIVERLREKYGIVQRG